MSSSGCCFSGFSTLIRGSRSQEESRSAELPDLLQGVVSSEVQRAVHDLEDSLADELQAVLKRLGQEDAAPSLHLKRRRPATQEHRNERGRFFTCPNTQQGDVGGNSWPVHAFSDTPEMKRGVSEPSGWQDGQVTHYASEPQHTRRSRTVSGSSSRAGSKSSAAEGSEDGKDVVRMDRADTERSYVSENRSRSSSLAAHYDLLDFLSNRMESTSSGSRREHTDSKGRLKHRLSHRHSASSVSVELSHADSIRSEAEESLPHSLPSGSITPGSAISHSDESPRSHPTEEDVDDNFAHTPKKVRRSSSGWRHDALDVGEVKAISSGHQRKSRKHLSLIGLVQSERERWIQEKQALEDRLQELKARQEKRQQEQQGVDTEKQELKDKLQELRKAVAARSRFGAWLCKKHMEESDDEETVTRNSVKEQLRVRIDELQVKLAKARSKAAAAAQSEGASSSDGRQAASSSDGRL